MSFLLKICADKMRSFTNINHFQEMVSTHLFNLRLNLRLDIEFVKILFNIIRCIC